MGPATPFFFVHVMKTGGTTFRWHVNRNFAPDERYPDGSVDDDLELAKLSVPRLLSQAAERLERVRIFTGHLPYSAAQQLRRPLTLMTVLRDPVDRTVSHLKQLQAQDPAGRSIEEVYEDPDLFGPVLLDHQVRMFALAPEDDIEGFYSLALDIDDARFTRACDNLAEVDLVGFQHRYDDFEAALAGRYGWTLADVGRLRESEPLDVSDALRRRIAEDNRADVEFYEYARGRYDRGY